MIYDRITVGNLTAIFMQDLDTIAETQDFRYEPKFEGTAAASSSVYAKGELSGETEFICDAKSVDELVKALEKHHGAPIIWVPTPIDGDISIYYAMENWERENAEDDNQVFDEDRIATVKQAMADEILTYTRAYQFQIYCFTVLDEHCNIIHEVCGFTDIAECEQAARKYLEEQS